jgi:hypothetical protein
MVVTAFAMVYPRVAQPDNPSQRQGNKRQRMIFAVGKYFWCINLLLSLFTSTDIELGIFNVFLFLEE